jgi:acyl dehydratase
MHEPAAPSPRLTPAQILAAARQLIGVETAPIEAMYPIEYEPIRRYCHAAGDTNPLFLDPAHARSTAYGAVLCPPLALRAVMMLPGEPLDHPFPAPPPELPILPPIPGGRAMSMNLDVEWEFLAPVRVGDRISETSRYADFYFQPIKLDPQAIAYVTERIYRNQDQIIVAISRTTSLIHRTPDEVRAMEATTP